MKTITVNGKEVIVTGTGLLSYEDICNIAHPPQYTVIYHLKKQEGGTLCKGENLIVENGTVIDCVFTGNA